MFTIRRSRGRQRGQSTIEYGVLIATIVVIFIAAVATLGPNVSNLVTDTVGQVAGITDGSSGGGAEPTATPPACEPPTCHPDPSPTATPTPGVATKLLILFPGEVADLGSPTGKSGTATPAVYNVPVIVTIKAVDGNWSTVTTETSVINFFGDGDPNAYPPPAALVAGVVTFTVTFSDFIAGNYAGPGSIYYFMAQNENWSLNGDGNLYVGP